MPRYELVEGTSNKFWEIADWARGETFRYTVVGE
jgi:hypothetical protein